jgi:multiple sugar transport system permease protein
MLLHPDVGTLGSFLADLGADRPVLADPGLAIWGVILAAAWKGFPFYMLLIYSGLTSVPQDLYDAARTDGAGRWRLFRDIELPEIMPVIVIAAIVGFVGTFNWLVPILIMTEGGPGGATTTLGIYIYQEGLKAFRIANSAAASAALLLVVLAMLGALFLWRLYSRRLGGVVGDQA